MQTMKRSFLKLKHLFKSTTTKDEPEKGFFDENLGIRLMPAPFLRVFFRTPRAIAAIIGRDNLQRR
jgi:hypothetical protein